MHIADVRRIMQENVVLLNEVNELRRELSHSKTSVHALEATLRSTKKLHQMRAGSTSPAGPPRSPGTLPFLSLAETQHPAKERWYLLGFINLRKQVGLRALVELQERRLLYVVNSILVFQPHSVPVLSLYFFSGCGATVTCGCAGAAAG